MDSTPRWRDVAKHAGVGVGTVYRRFASKDELIQALFDTRCSEIETIAATAREMPDAWEGLVYFLDVISLRMADNRGFGDLLMDGRFTSDTFARARAGIARHTAVLVNRAKEQGTLRSDFEVNDIPLLMQVVKMAQKFGGDEAPQAYRRALGFMIDGLCASPHRPSRVARPGAVLRATRSRPSSVSGNAREELLRRFRGRRHCGVDPEICCQWAITGSPSAESGSSPLRRTRRGQHRADCVDTCCPIKRCRIALDGSMRLCQRVQLAPHQVVRGSRGRNRTEQCGSDRPAHLLHRVDGSRRNARVFVMHTGNCPLHGRRDDATHSEATHEESRHNIEGISALH